MQSSERKRRRGEKIDTKIREEVILLLDLKIMELSFAFGLQYALTQEKL